MVGTTGRMQLSPRKTIVTISSEADGCQEVVGSSSEAVLNQRTDDRILEMFSTGLMSWEGGGLEPDACQSSLQLGFRIQGRRAEAWERGRGRHSWTCSSASASIFEVFESAGGSVTGRNVWVAVSGHGQTGVCGWQQQPAVERPCRGRARRLCTTTHLLQQRSYLSPCVCHDVPLPPRLERSRKLKMMLAI